MTQNDGGPAFPRPYSVDSRDGSGPNIDGDSPQDAEEGMSLRDYFAGQAIIAILTAKVDGQGFTRHKHEITGETLGNTTNLPQQAAAAYELADALLAARTKEQT